MSRFDNHLFSRCRIPPSGERGAAGPGGTPLCSGFMEDDHPLVREVYPELIEELARLLEQIGERYLSISVRDVRMVAPCECRDDFCQSIRTAEHESGTPYGPGHRNVMLDPDEGMLILDVMHERIVYIEVLFRAPLKRR